MTTKENEMAPSKKPKKRSSSKTDRSLRNFILQPFLQVRLGLYSILLSMFFMLAIAGVLYLNLAKFSEIILQLTGVEEEVRDLLNQYTGPTIVQTLVLVFLYGLVNIIVAVVFTHKLVGPTIAFRRHIRMIKEGRYDYRTTLRKGDAFSEVANDLNDLSAHLSEIQNRK
jgi:hypothetical protein